VYKIEGAKIAETSGKIILLFSLILYKIRD